jgi:hypothetical protein
MSMTTLNHEAGLDNVPEGKGMLAILDTTGDSRIIWDPGNDDEVAAAKNQFDELIKKGFRAFSVNRKGDKDKQVRTPAIVGG